MKEDIMWSSLPKTFQDAVNVTQWFEIKYLWIDSLCIIQDSNEDWERESKSMKHIYQNYFLNVAALNAVDVAGGLFADRNSNAVRLLKVQLQWSRELKGDYRWVDHLSHIEDLKAPLMKRAWVFQERLLSPRVLYFGRSQMYWECQTLDGCETFPENIPDVVHVKSTKRLLQDENSFFRAWGGIVRQYSIGKLTHISDKCIAFAGIVEEAQALTGSGYIAGFWRHNLEQQLLWGVLRRLSKNRPQSYLAPSWSWLSVDSVICVYDYRRCTRVILDILDVSVTNLNDDVLGPIKHGYIRARGILGSAIWTRRFQWEWKFRLIRGRRPLRRCGTNWIRMDESTDGNTHDAVYLPIVIHEDLGIHGLLLTPT